MFTHKGEHVMKFEMSQAKKIQSKLDIAFSLGKQNKQQKQTNKISNKIPQCIKILGQE